MVVFFCGTLQIVVLHLFIITEAFAALHKKSGDNCYFGSAECKCQKVPNNLLKVDCSGRRLHALPVFNTSVIWIDLSNKIFHNLELGNDGPSPLLGTRPGDWCHFVAFFLFPTSPPDPQIASHNKDYKSYCHPYPESNNQRFDRRIIRDGLLTSHYYIRYIRVVLCRFCCRNYIFFYGVIEIH